MTYDGKVDPVLSPRERSIQGLGKAGSLKHFSWTKLIKKGNCELNQY